ncbi:MAG: TIGR01777 family oxidoreductase [Thermoplasmata archaeon]
MINTLIAGGSGFIGRHLSKKVKDSGGEVALLTRKTDPSIPYGQIAWNPTAEGDLSGKEIEGYDMVVNLAGAGIEKKWSDSYKNEIVESRVKSTAALVNAINSASTKPKYFVSASAIGYYGNVEDGNVDEDSTPGNDFLASLSVRWEEEAKKVDKSVKLLIPRFGVILGSDGGAFPQLLRGASSGASFNMKGKAGWKSWVHIDDAVSSIIFMTQIGYEGAYNVVTPNPLRMDGLMNIIASEIGKKIRIRMGPTLARMVLGEGSDYSVFGGQKVLPKRLLEKGFAFKYPDIQDALKDLLAKQI